MGSNSDQIDLFTLHQNLKSVKAHILAIVCNSLEIPACCGIHKRPLGS